MRRLTRAFIFLASLSSIPAIAYAQASIAGVVKDSSGAVLPGVTVEAASDVLIEKVRIAVTDSTGQFRVVDLRPGTYSVTFKLTGFSAVRREGIELTGVATTTVNADLRVGALSETITVTGETPIVDMPSARRQTTVTNVGFDLYNLLNSSAVLSYNQNFVPNVSWLRPTLLLTSRFAKISATIDF
jgi:hypothetical protein